MRTGRPKQPLTLSAEERERLASLAHRARTCPYWRGGRGSCWPVPTASTTRTWADGCEPRWGWWGSGAPDSCKIGRGAWRGRGEISGVAGSLKKKKETKTRLEYELVS